MFLHTFSKPPQVLYSLKQNWTRSCIRTLCIVTWLEILYILSCYFFCLSVCLNILTTDALLLLFSLSGQVPNCSLCAVLIKSNPTAQSSSDCMWQYDSPQMFAAGKWSKPSSLATEDAQKDKSLFWQHPRVGNAEELLPLLIRVKMAWVLPVQIIILLIKPVLLRR